MDYKDAADAIYERLRARWASSHAADCPIAWPGMNFDPEVSFVPASHKGWISPHVLWGDAYQAELGTTTRRHRTPGVCVVQVFAPSGQGHDTLLDLADDVVLAVQAVSTGGVVLRSASLSAITRDGSWFQVNVNTPFWFDRIA